MKNEIIMKWRQFLRNEVFHHPHPFTRAKGGELGKQTSFLQCWLPSTGRRGSPCQERLSSRWELSEGCGTRTLLVMHHQPGNVAEARVSIWNQGYLVAQARHSQWGEDQSERWQQERLGEERESEGREGSQALT